jgi:hypothetical protein
VGVPAFADCWTRPRGRHLDCSLTDRTSARRPGFPPVQQRDHGRDDDSRISSSSSHARSRSPPAGKDFEDGSCGFSNTIRPLSHCSRRHGSPPAIWRSMRNTADPIAATEEGMLFLAPCASSVAADPRALERCDGNSRSAVVVATIQVRGSNARTTSCDTGVRSVALVLASIIPTRMFTPHSRARVITVSQSGFSLTTDSSMSLSQ